MGVEEVTVWSLAVAMHVRQERPALAWALAWAALSPARRIVGGRRRRLLAEAKPSPSTAHQCPPALTRATPCFTQSLIRVQWKTDVLCLLMVNRDCLPQLLQGPIDLGFTVHATFRCVLARSYALHTRASSGYMQLSARRPLVAHRVFVGATMADLCACLRESAFSPGLVLHGGMSLSLTLKSTLAQTQYPRKLSLLDYLTQYRAYI
jgi:hypothetical protein